MSYMSIKKFLTLGAVAILASLSLYFFIIQTEKFSQNRFGNEAATVNSSSSQKLQTQLYSRDYVNAFRVVSPAQGELIEVKTNPVLVLAFDQNKIADTGEDFTFAVAPLDSSGRPSDPFLPLSPSRYGSVFAPGLVTYSVGGIEGLARGYYLIRVGQPATANTMKSSNSAAVFGAQVPQTTKPPVTAPSNDFIYVLIKKVDNIMAEAAPAKTQTNMTKTSPVSNLSNRPDNYNQYKPAGCLCTAMKLKKPENGKLNVDGVEWDVDSNTSDFQQAFTMNATLAPGSDPAKCQEYQQVKSTITVDGKAYYSTSKGVNVFMTADQIKEYNDKWWHLNKITPAPYEGSALVSDNYTKPADARGGHPNKSHGSNIQWFDAPGILDSALEGNPNANITMKMQLLSVVNPACSCTTDVTTVIKNGKLDKDNTKLTSTCD